MFTVLGWGSNQHAQLGIGYTEEGGVIKPQVIHALQGNDIEDISNGDRHSLFLSRTGKVYSCGDNEWGQLGQDRSLFHPEQVLDLDSHFVMQVAAGACHSLSLTKAGEVFSWGDNSRGQLGRGPVNTQEAKTPKLIKALVPYTVIQIASGNNHCLALTDNGIIFSWGDNRFCQLGLGISMENCDKPNPIHCLQGIPVAQVATGGCHSFILSQSGQVFGWGKNSFGQLGLSDEKDRPHPSLCKSLKNQKVKYITCGEDHTVALTQDGGVFTFGSGTYGQLGHGMKNNEILPRKVMELMGSNVIQVACGRRHTMTLKEDSCKIYTFGAGGCGQLGTGSNENSCSPSVLLWDSLASHINGMTAYAMNSGSIVVKRIIAGGDNCFLIVSLPEKHFPPDDFREHKFETKIKCLDEKLLREISKIERDEEIPYHVTEDVTKIFSSASCINASFLLKNDEHYGCNSKNHGVDLEAVKGNFKLLAECPNIVIKQKIVQSLENCLLPSLPSSPPDVETLRLYLILPELHLFEEPKRFSTLIVPFGKAILDLDKPASKVLEMWWGGLSSSYFLKIVYVYKETVVYILQLPDPQNMKELEVRYRALHVFLEVLKRLNYVNELKGQIIPYHKFYISLLKDKVNIKGDYIMWIQQNRGPSNQARLIFCNYPFTFDAAAKSLLLQTDALLQMQTAIDEVQRRNLQSLFLPINPANPCLVFYVSRQNIIRDTLEQLSHQGSADLKKPLKVTFIGEEAQDEGGVRKEFFMLLLREVLDPKYGMFKFYEESRLYWFSSMTFEDKQMYLLIGCLCGLAIYNFTIIQLSFPQALYKKLLKRSPNLEDMKELVPSVGRGLENLLEYPDENVEEAFGLTFEVTQECFGVVKTIELVRGGASKSVTHENRKEYVDMYIDYVFNKSVHDRFEAFYHGFHKVCGGRVLELFHPEELRAMVTGNENYDFIELEKNTDYKGEYHRYHETIKLFWDVFHDLSLEEKKKFLLFLTGSDKIPITGMKHFKITIQPMNVDEIYLPVAHTCFNLLDLPRYKSKEQMAVKLKQAIEQTEGFGLV